MTPELENTPLPTSTATPALTEAAAAPAASFRPKVEFEVISMRELYEKLSPADHDKLIAYLENDPKLEQITAAVLPNPESPDDLLSAKTAELIANKLAEQFSPDARQAITTLVDFYLGYLRPFPDKTEVEPLSSLVGYLDNLPNWDVLMAKSAAGKIIGACSGQVVDVDYAGGNFKVAWNEHTWADADYRRMGIASTLAKTFTENARRDGAIGVVIETDNPFLITNEAAAFNHADPEARGKFWKEDLLQSMDPFERFQFWGGQGFGLIVSGNPPVPVSYEQISMELGEVGSCKTINLAFQPTQGAYQTELPKDMYAALLVALQKTVDERAEYYPELVRTMKQVAEIPEATFKFINLKEQAMLTAMVAGRASKEGSTEADIAYCDSRLAQSIGADEREVLEQTRAFLTKSDA